MKFSRRDIESPLGYTFGNPDLLQQAFVRRSYSEEYGGQNNEVLEFIGDKALDIAVIYIMAERFGVITETKEWDEFKMRNPRYYNTKKEGVFTDIKKDLVKSNSLARVIDNLGFQKYLIMGHGDELNNVQEQDSVKEDLFEAIIGAVTIDSNWDIETIVEVVKTLIDFDAYFNNELEDDDYIGELLYLFQEGDDEPPRYIYKKTEDGYRCTLTGCYRNFGLDCVGYGPNKASARNNAARKAMAILREHGYIINRYEEEVGKPSEEFAIKQINELVQKRLISKPEYTFEEIYSEDGVPMWKCEVEVDELSFTYDDIGYSKKEAQRKAVYCLLKDLMYLDDGDEDE